MKSIFPPTIAAGLTFDSTAQLSEYPAPDWVLTAHLRGPTVIDITAAADGTGHKFEEAATVTAAWGAGVYSYTVRATKSGEVRQVEVGQVEILPDLAANTTPHDVRTHARKTLDAIRAVIEGRATIDQERYVIEGQNGRRELWRTPLPELQELERAYSARVAREEAKSRGKSQWGPAVRVRFL